MTTEPGRAIIIFGDGACSGNPGPGGWGAVIATPDGRVWEMGGGSPSTTNNQMELTAAIEALRSVSGMPGEVHLFTDSLYVIRGITQWIWGWRQRGWKSAEGKDVANRELWERLSAVASARRRPNQIAWKYVRGHSNIPGNERVDEIAVAFSKGGRPALFVGSLKDYTVDLASVPDDTEPPENHSRKGTKDAPYSYLSLLGSVAERHRTWAECERRVKGQPGAKFKKAKSAEDEAGILRSWGVDPKSLKP